MNKLLMIGLFSMGAIDSKNISFTVNSPDFGHGQTIPATFSGEGAHSVPHIIWAGVPTGTKSLALICDDPDAPRQEPFVHWIVYNIPATAAHLDFLGRREEKNKNGTMQGQNSYQQVGYDGPNPPKGHGVHHYHFKLYAVDSMLSLNPAATKKELLSAMQGHILGQTELVGLYERR